MTTDRKNPKDREPFRENDRQDRGQVDHRDEQAPSRPPERKIYDVVDTLPPPDPKKDST